MVAGNHQSPISQARLQPEAGAAPQQQQQSNTQHSRHDQASTEQ